MLRFTGESKKMWPFKKEFNEKIDVPKELPQLAIDVLSRREQNIQGINIDTQAFEQVTGTIGNEPIGQLIKGEEKSYFQDLLKNIIEETKDITKVEEWYKKRVAPQDMLYSMRKYWENQRTGMLFGGGGKKLKKELLHRIARLQQLEKEWQDRYFSLIDKEEEIKTEEIELKKILGEFATLCKRYTER